MYVATDVDVLLKFDFRNRSKVCAASAGCLI